LTLFKVKPVLKANVNNGKTKPECLSSRPFISGNLSDLFDQTNAVVLRHYEGDKRVPDIVAEKCIELLKALADHAEPE
jgi:hypothetical protein